MQLECFVKDYNLNDARFSNISEDINVICAKADIGIEDIIGVGTFDYSNNVVHYGFVTKAITPESLAELKLQTCYATLPDSNWTVYTGPTIELPTLYETINNLQRIHSFIEKFHSDGTCFLYVQ